MNAYEFSGGYLNEILWKCTYHTKSMFWAVHLNEFSGGYLN
uniref:Uncharacterized protein n=1 Tax=Anguilla anguilla TaxID=7936 RepID=A0A0E9WK32_ANGAN